MKRLAGAVLVVALAATLAGCAGAAPPHFVVRDAGDGDHSGIGFSDADPISEAGGNDNGSTCGPSNCLGCCLPDGFCTAGTEDTECGKNGALCGDCTASKSSCQDNTCAGCTPACEEKPCGGSDSCGDVCQPGSGCCDGCLEGETCHPGTSPSLCGRGGEACSTCSSSGACESASCSTGTCQVTKTPDGEICKGGRCYGGTCCTGCWDGGSCRSGTETANCGREGETCTSCANWYTCDGSCYCGPSPDYKLIDSVCKPSCGAFLNVMGWSNNDNGCCPSGCNPWFQSSSASETHDCTYCCENGSVSACL